MRLTKPGSFLERHQYVPLGPGVAARTQEARESIVDFRRIERPELQQRFIRGDSRRFVSSRLVGFRLESMRLWIQRIHRFVPRGVIEHFWPVLPFRRLLHQSVESIGGIGREVSES